jgi:hypothetical protein
LEVAAQSSEASSLRGFRLLYTKHQPGSAELRYDTEVTRSHNEATDHMQESMYMARNKFYENVFDGLNQRVMAALICANV